jgi:lipoprotein-releasing system permease protein
MPWPVYLAFKHLFPAGRRASFFTVVSILGVALGVMVLLVVQSVMNGFAHEYELNFIRSQGHIQIRSNDLITNPGEVVKLAETVPGVVSAAPFLQGMVMLQFDNHVAFTTMRGLGWPTDYPRTAAEKAAAPPTNTAFPFMKSMDVNHPGKQPMADVLIAGNLDDLDDDSILLGSGLAASLGVVLADKVDVYTPLMLDRLKNNNEVLLPRQFRVAGIYETGWTVADDNSFVTTLRTMQDFYGVHDAAMGVEVRLDSDDMARTGEITEALNAQLDKLNAQRGAAGAVAPLRAYPWYQTNSDTMKVLFIEKTMMFFIMIIIVVVASFSIAISLVTSVVRKTREIGVLGALGARPGQVASVFCLQGFFIGVAGTALGVALALLLLHFRQPIVEAFVNRQLLLEFYKFLSFPVEYRASTFTTIIVFTLVITTAAGLVPAWYAARLKPAECLRYE